MATDLAVTVEDKPGELANLGEATGRAGINIDGVGCFSCQGRFVVHLLVDDAAGARRAIEGAGYTVIEERDVVVAGLEDRPGALGETTRKVADAGVNIELAYLATNTRLVLGAADVDKMKAVI
ncbi:MAG: ACT domain-containing protein [Acidimicrobiales bacterium]